MSENSGTESSVHETEMRPSLRLSAYAAVLFLLGAHLFFSAILTALLAFIPMLALVSIWTYIPTLPFLMLAILCFASRLEELEFVKCPALLCMATAPFITWYCRTAGRNSYFAVCLLLLCVSVPWLLQSINLFHDLVYKRWLAGTPDGGLFRQAIRLSYKSVIYFVIAPLCADLVGIVYRAKDAEHVLIYIIDNITASVPIPMVFLHYGGLVFTLLFQSAIAVSLAFKLIRRNDDRTNNSAGLFD